MNSNNPLALPASWFRHHPGFIALAFACGLATGSQASPVPQFSAPVNYNCTNCEQIATGDFNSDGKMDLVVSSSVTHLLTVFTNNGSGSFVVCTNYPSPGTPRSIAVGEFNGDTNLDLLAVNYPGSPNDCVTVWTGNGNGTFAPPKNTSVSINDSYTGVAVGDFNNDGKLDVVVATYGPQILLGQGNGFFTFLTNYNNGLTYAVAAGYFDGDTNLDFVTGNYSSSSMSVFLGNGDGTCPPPTNYSGDNSEYHYAVAAGDFNNDGKSDIATVNYHSGSVSVRTNTGNGWFGAETRYKTPFAPQAMAVTDFNGDGNLDILTASSSANNSLAVLCGNGNGTFAAALTNFPGLSGILPNQCIAVADFDGDGRPDIASTCTAANSLTLRLNQTVPEVQIQAAGGNRFKLMWPNWTGYALEFATNLQTTHWARLVSGASLLANGQNVFTNPPPTGNRFFRLSQ